jgi:phosphoglycerate kinase
MSHVGRPDGTVEEDYRMNPMAERLSELLHIPVAKVDEVVGDSVKSAVEKMVAGDVLMLENNRFEPGETKNDEELAKKLASVAQVYVNDGFSLSHRAHASVEAITRFLPSYAGFTLAKEVEMLSKLTDNPKKPLVVIVGGAKISDKVDAIKNLTTIADIILVGGGVANNFLKAEGLEVYNSYLQDSAVDEDKKEVDYVEFAKNLIEANSTDRMLLDDYIPLPKIVYPTDVYAAKDKNDVAGKHIVNLIDDGREVNTDVMYLDIGPKTQKLYQEIILQAETIFWNGPMGVFEEEAFAEGTATIAQALAKSKATTIVGGGDTIHAIDIAGTAERYDYVSASGGASLEFLGGKMLPGIKPLIA